MFFKFIFGTLTNIVTNHILNSNINYFNKFRKFNKPFFFLIPLNFTFKILCKYTFIICGLFLQNKCVNNALTWDHH